MKNETRDRLYSAYATTHAGPGNRLASRLAFEREVAPRLAVGPTARVLDLGCGQGDLVAEFHRAGFREARGVDISPEQVSIAHNRGVANIELGDYRAVLEAGEFDVVTANDFLEHLDLDEVLEALDLVLASLSSEGILIARTPNLSSPFGGGYRYGDLTHVTSFNARSLLQLGNTAGFASTETFSCPPKAHGLKSGARAAIWKAASGAMKLALVAETGRLRGHHVTQNILVVMKKS